MEDGCGSDRRKGRIFRCNRYRTPREGGFRRVVSLSVGLMQSLLSPSQRRSFILGWRYTQRSLLQMCSSTDVHSLSWDNESSAT